MKKQITLLTGVAIMMILCIQLQAQIVCTIDNSTSYSTAPALVNGAAYKNFTDAFSKLNATAISSPVIFNVAAGETFTETATLSLSRSGTATNTITFRRSGVGINPVVIPVAGTGNLDAAIRLLGVSYISFDGIDIAENTASTTAVQKMEVGYYLVSSTSIANTHNTITNCNIALDRTNTNASYGIYQNGTGSGPSCAANLFSHLSISNVFCGIYLNGKTSSGDDSATISHCNIGSSTAHDIGGNSAIAITNGISCKYQNNLTISNCEVKNVTANSTATSSEANGISILFNGGTSAVFNNKIYNISNRGTSTTVGVTSGLQLSNLSSGTLQVYNNMISGIYTGELVVPGGSASAVKLGGITIAIGSLGTTNLYHNSILLQNGSTNYLVGTACLNASSTASNTVTAVNNIFSNRYIPGAAGCYCIFTNNTSTNAYTSFATSNYNNFDFTTGTNRYAGKIAGANQATLAAWKSSTGKDANSRQFVAAYLDTTAASANLHLNLGAVDSSYNGVAITTPPVTTDIDGDLRSTTVPNMGADEVLISGPVAATWPLTPTNPAGGISTGSITALDMRYDSLMYRDNATPTGPLGELSRRFSCDTAGTILWPYGGYNARYYFEFRVVAPAAQPLTINYLKIPMGAANTGNMRAEVQYSTNQFATSNYITSGPISLINGAYLSPAPQFDTHIVVDAGDTLSIRVFPYLSSSSTSKGRYIYLQGVELSGTTGATPAPQPQPAFPGAEGAGKYITGGRGSVSVPTTVYEVTNLLDTNVAGSIRYACKATATNRTIVFRVSGTIHLKAELDIPANTTLAGQTAPGDGICFADYSVNVGGNNVIVRNVRFRMGDRYQNKGVVVSAGDDAFEAYKKSKLIIDHCSMSWGTDEAFSSYGGDSLTLSWNLVSEPLDSSYHYENSQRERHALAAFWGGRNATFHHNLIAHAQGRFPRLSGSNNYSPAGEGAEKADLINNVMYNWGPYSTDGGAGGRYNILNNYYKYGPNANGGSKAGVQRKYMFMAMSRSTTTGYTYGKAYVAGNYMDGNAATTANNWLGMSMSETVQSDTVLAKMYAMFPSLQPIALEPAQDAYQSVLKGAGAIMPRRDTLDQRIVNDVINRTGRIIDVQGGYPPNTPYATTVNAWPTLLSLPAPTDGDHDGMPGAWEARRGLDSANAADRNGYTANGYTNLENYLNGDSIVAAGRPGNCVTARSVSVTAIGGWADLKDTTYSYNIATDTMNVVASINNNGNHGTVQASYCVQSATRTLSGKPYLNRNVTIVPAGAPASLKIRLYFTKAEYDSLVVADPTIGSLEDLRVLVVADNNCLTALSGSYTTINPSATGIWGTYQNGYYLEFETSAYGSFFIAGADFLAAKQLETLSTVAKPSELQEARPGHLSLSPNPSRGYVIVRHEAAGARASLRLVSADGKVLLRQQPAKGTVMTELYLTQLTGGMYWIVWENPGGLNQTLPLLKQ